MQSTHPTGTHRVCYQCDNPAQSGSMFCPECLPERFPPIVHEKPPKPPKPPRRSLWQAVAGLLRLRSHTRNLTERIKDMELELLDTQQANALLRKRCERVKDELKQLAQAYDEVEAERSKLARKVTSIAIDWAPVTEIALKHLGSSAEMPNIAAWAATRLNDYDPLATDAAEAWRIGGYCKERCKWDGEGSLATFVINRLRQPSAGQNAVTAVSEQPSALPAPLGQNPETEIAPGHNPDLLTAAQVGARWKLLEEPLTIYDAFPHWTIERWDPIAMGWTIVGKTPNCDTTYRVRI